MRLILASASPRRKQILHDMGITFTVCPANVDEISEHLYPERVPVVNAIAKAELIADQYPADLVMGADTVIEFSGKVVGKPIDMDDARRILLEFSGHTHAVVTAVCLICRATHAKCVFSQATMVTFHRFGPEVAEEYLRRVEVLDKAGAYAIQEYGDMLVKKIAGPQDNVVGLPGDRLREALYCCGFTSLRLKDAPLR